MYKKKTSLKSYLHIFIASILALLVIGILFIYSSSSVYALQKHGSGGYFVKKHLFGLFIGVSALFITLIIPLSFIKKITPLAFIGSLALTALTLFQSFAIRVHGSSRWISLCGFSFQPSELLKIAFICYLAFFFTRKDTNIHSFTRSYLPFLLLLIITSCVLLKQPDFGLTVTLAITACILIFVAGARPYHLICTFLTCIPIVFFLIYTQPYRIKRVLTFLNPWADPQGAGFQIIQSLIAIGSGGSYGVGIAHSKQKFFYLPMQHTDFIFSIIAEETGFIGSFIIIFLFLIVLYAGIHIACTLSDPFCAYTVLGFVLLITIQALINLAVATSLVPTKGIGLPFVSYGNTALVSYFIMIGLIMTMVRHNKPQTAY